MVDHHEAWQVFGANGTPVDGQSIKPIESRQTSAVIVGAVHVWFWRQNQDDSQVEVLLQRRSKTKPTWPDRLDISVAGHVDAGETLLEAIVREGEEEVGCTINTDALDYFMSYRNFDNGLKWVYLYHFEEDEAEFVFNDGEVQSLEWVSIQRLEEMIEEPLENNLVPHPPEYYSWLVSTIRRVSDSENNRS